MAIFYFINWEAAAETIEGGKLFKGEIRYLHIPQSFLHYFHKVRYFDGKFHYHQLENFQYLQHQL